MSLRVGILGYGEIGSSVHKVYSTSNVDSQIFIKDLTKEDSLNNLDVLNVCIPYNESFDFVELVVKVATDSKAKIVINHSTVPVGITRIIKKKLQNVAVCHSPCRGVHPNLFEGLMTFEKFVGCPSLDDAEFCVSHLNSLGIVTYLCESSETSELAKLLDTSYYGVCISFHAEADKACKQFGVNFEEVMTRYNTSYNEGYTTLRKTNVIRPILQPPNGGIGGHCVVQNAELLSQQFKSPLLDTIISYKKAK